MSSGVSAGLSIKNIQRGTILIGSGSSSNTATITAVNVAKSELHFLGQTTGNDAARNRGRIDLTNSTTVTYTAAITTTTGIEVSFEVIEYF